MSVRYKEVEFANEEEREKGVRYILENAEVSIPERAVRIGMTTFRVSLHLLKDQYFLVHEPREKELLLPRVWLITIPGFRLCELPMGKEMVPCHRRVRSVAVRDSEMVYVCDYHGAGLSVVKGVVDRQVRVMPAPLCVRFCPQGVRYGVKIVKGRELPVYQCRAFMTYMDEKEERKRRRPFGGMFVLCVEDWWWRQYLRRREG